MKMEVRVLGSSSEDLWAKIRRLIKAMNPAGIDGDPVMKALSYVTPDRTENKLYCRVTGGLEVEGEETKGLVSHVLPLTFLADDPYWYGPTQTKGFTGADATAWFPIFRPDGSWLGPSTVMGEIEVATESDVPTYGRMVAVGPGIQPRFINNRSGEKLVLGQSVQLNPNEALTVDTAAATVIGPDGSNWFPKLTERSLWPLLPGVNPITAAMSGTTTASYVAFSWEDRKLTTS